MTPSLEELLRERIASIANFPISGIDFKDITPLLADGERFGMAVDELVARLAPLDFEAVVAIESRGFVLGAPVAAQLRRSLVLIRKGGRLPGEIDAFPYRSEYATGTLEARRGSVRPGARYLVVDDLLATGGTARATADYIEGAGGVLAGFGFLIELSFLDGRRALPEAPVVALLAY